MRQPIVHGPSAPLSSALAAEPALLELREVRRSFGAVRALCGVSLRIRAKETFALLGPPGAGKSTALQILAGLLRPDEGEVRFAGKVATVEDPVLRGRTGVVLQGGEVEPSSTAREALMLAARMHAVLDPEALRRADELLAHFDLAERADEPVGGLAAGMRRTLDVARALMHRPKVLLLDEPAKGADETAARRLWSQLKQLHEREGLTLVAATGRPEQAELCDRVAIVDGGRLVACDEVAALVQRVDGDVLTIEAEGPEDVARVLGERFGLAARVVEGRVHAECRAGPVFIPGVVEAFALGRLHSVSLRRPTLADVFVKLTGHRLGVERGPAGGRRKRGG